MPRRTKDAEDMTDTTTETAATTEDATAAGGSETNGNGTEEAAAAKRSSVDDLPLGPTQTRTGAAATVIQGPKGKRVFTAGGDKGAKIAELLKTKPEMPRKEIAALVGCSQSRVAEVARVLGLATARPPSTTGPESGDAESEPAEAATPAESAPTSVST